MKILFFTFYFPPDLSAGSFRSKALVKALKSCNRKLDIHIITTIPNRYSSFEQECESVEYLDTATIHRIIVPKHNGSMLNQCKSFLIFAIKSLFMVFYIKPDFMIATTSRLMTGMLTFTASKLLRRPYFLDIRDIFSESISDTLASNCKILSQLCKKKIQVIEKIVIKNAAGVNLVSEGFNEYFLAYLNKEKKFSNYTNAIDEEFFKQNENFIAIKKSATPL